jgi:hypothetical protein
MFRYIISWIPCCGRAWLATIALLTTVFLSNPAPVRAQSSAGPDWNNAGDPLVGAIGLHYGQLGGHGLAFRAPLRWWLYFQVAGGVWHTADKKQHNVGFNLNYILRQDQRVRVFINAGPGTSTAKKRWARPAAGTCTSWTRTGI